uniref:RING-type domain-containing protein n=1 Tax=Picea sitchensis TaxID=3332 RepID=B8LNA0_PICSI|nr:unknown [Picea sitchensis]
MFFINLDRAERFRTCVIMCAICMDSLSVGELVKRLPCLHRYHVDCILPLLSSRNLCPLCRYELPTNELPTDDPAYEEQRKQGASSRNIIICAVQVVI